MLNRILVLSFLIYLSSANAETLSPSTLPQNEQPLAITSMPIATPTVVDSIRKVAVVFVNGGYNSCAGNVPTSGPNMGQIAETNYLTNVGDKAMEYVIQPLKDQGFETYWVISCFWGSTSYTLQVKSSTNLTTATIIPWSSTVAWSPNPQMFYDYLSTFAQTYMSGAMAELRVVLIGHSNGGFTMLKLAELLADSVTVANHRDNHDTNLVLQVHTLDAISTECSPSSISLGFGTMPPSCLRAPTVTEVNYTKIRNEFGILNNSYQTNYTTLHSGAITLATDNTLVNLPGVQSTSNNSHTRITSDLASWESIKGMAVPVP